MLGERAKMIGLRLYGGRTPCYDIPEGAPWASHRMVWFTGYEQNIACPANEQFWQSALIEDAASAGLLWQIPTGDQPVLAVINPLPWEHTCYLRCAAA